METRILLQHVQGLGFLINQEKSMLYPAQEVVFLGLSLNSEEFRERLSTERASTHVSCSSVLT